MLTMNAITDWPKLQPGILKATLGRFPMAPGQGGLALELLNLRCLLHAFVDFCIGDFAALGGALLLLLVALRLSGCFLRER